jgi:sarcosine oxidase
LKPDVIVVGLGAVGAATLYQLARRGVQVLGIDQFSPPHDRGSSHGETRITRQAVGEGDDYVPLALRAHEIWRELESQTGTNLLDTCGLLLIGSGDGRTLHHGKPDFVMRSRRAAERFGIPHEMLSVEAAARRYPQFLLRGDERVYFEPGAGLVYPERCIAAQLSEAERLGARIIRGERVLSLTTAAGCARVTTNAGVHEAGQAVLTAGAWTPGLVGAPLQRLVVQPQVLHWFQPLDPRIYAAERCPVFIWMYGPAPEDTFYGFPLAAGAETQAVKVATEKFDTLAAPEDLDRSPGPRLASEMFETHVRGRLAGLAPRALKSSACLYTMAPDADFVIGRAPRSERVLIASACSGHGFKHSPAVGELVARIALSEAEPPDAFSLARLV